MNIKTLTEDQFKKIEFDANIEDVKYEQVRDFYLNHPSVSLRNEMMKNLKYFIQEITPSEYFETGYDSIIDGIHISCGKLIWNISKWGDGEVNYIGSCPVECLQMKSDDILRHDITANEEKYSLQNEEERLKISLEKIQYAIAGLEEIGEKSESLINKKIQIENELGHIMIKLRDYKDKKYIQIVTK